MKDNIKIAVICWNDASYSYRKKLPVKLPDLDITFGVIISQTKEFVNIGMNCCFDKKKRTLKSVDGMLIPKKAIINIKYIKNYIL